MSKHMKLFRACLLLQVATSDDKSHDDFVDNVQGGFASAIGSKGGEAAIAVLVANAEAYGCAASVEASAPVPIAGEAVQSTCALVVGASAIALLTSYCLTKAEEHMVEHFRQNHWTGFKPKFVIWEDKLKMLINTMDVHVTDLFERITHIMGDITIDGFNAEDHTFKQDRLTDVSRQILNALNVDMADIVSQYKIAGILEESSMLSDPNDVKHGAYPLWIGEANVNKRTQYRGILDGLVSFECGQEHFYMDYQQTSDVGTTCMAQLPECYDKCCDQQRQWCNDNGHNDDCPRQRGCELDANEEVTGNLKPTDEVQPPYDLVAGDTCLQVHVLHREKCCAAQETWCLAQESSRDSFCHCIADRGCAPAYCSAWYGEQSFLAAKMVNFGEYMTGFHGRLKTLVSQCTLKGEEKASCSDADVFLDFAKKSLPNLCGMRRILNQLLLTQGNSTMPDCEFTTLSGFLKATHQWKLHNMFKQLDDGTHAQSAALLMPDLIRNVDETELRTTIVEFIGYLDGASHEIALQQVKDHYSSLVQACDTSNKHLQDAYGSSSADSDALVEKWSNVRDSVCHAKAYTKTYVRECFAEGSNNVTCHAQTVQDWYDHVNRLLDDAKKALDLPVRVPSSPAATDQRLPFLTPFVLQALGIFIVIMTGVLCFIKKKVCRTTRSADLLSEPLVDSRHAGSSRCGDAQDAEVAVHAPEAGSRDAGSSRRGNARNAEVAMHGAKAGSSRHGFFR